MSSAPRTQHTHPDWLQQMQCVTAKFSCAGISTLPFF